MESTTKYKSEFECSGCGASFSTSRFIKVIKEGVDGQVRSALKARCPDCRASCLIPVEIESVSKNRPKFPLLAKEKHPGTNLTMIRRHRLNENPNEF